MKIFACLNDYAGLLSLLAVLAAIIVPYSVKMKSNPSKMNWMP